jgi:mannose-6-phosphate isomerase
MRFDAPLRLTSARAWRTYLGGRFLDELHGVASPADTHFPEEWICSAVRAVNPGREDVVEGLCRLAGTDLTLKDALEAHPAEMLGAAHVARWGRTPAVLVKLIDAAERLGVQVHPDRAAAMRFFASPFGKTECWHVVGGREIGGERPCVYLGFRPGVTVAAWRDVFDRQDVPAMLAMLNRVEAKPGDTFLIEGGTPHAIGAGCLLVEIQEPTDYTFRTEKVTPQGFRISDAACHYGIGFDNMFSCFHYDGRSEAETCARLKIPPRVLEAGDGFRRTALVGPSETPCFALERLEVADEMSFPSAPGAFCGLFVLSGRGTLESAAGAEPLRPCDQFFVPAASAGFRIRAESPLAIFLARPPQSPAPAVV